MFVIKGDLKSFLLKHPVTNGFILICALIALTTIFLHGGYSSASIVDFGGLDKELIEEGQLWRLFTYGFGHMSLFHFLLNQEGDTWINKGKNILIALEQDDLLIGIEKEIDRFKLEI